MTNTQASTRIVLWEGKKNTQGRSVLRSSKALWEKSRMQIPLIIYSLLVTTFVTSQKDQQNRIITGSFDQDFAESVYVKMSVFNIKLVFQQASCAPDPLQCARLHIISSINQLKNGCWKIISNLKRADLHLHRSLLTFSNLINCIRRQSSVTSVLKVINQVM